MSFIETVLDGSNANERKKKAVCAVAIIITAILLVIAIVAFSICQIVGTPSEDSDENTVPKIEQTETITLAPNAVNEGNLLTLNNNNHYKGDPQLVDIEKEREKSDAFISLFEKKYEFEATLDTANALFNLVKASNKALNDDNLILSGAYDNTKVDSQNGIYSSGEAIALSYCFEGKTDVANRLPINGVKKYNWIYQNAHKYGFVALSSDSNIFRYVGVQFATAIKTSGLSFDAFTEKLKAATPENPVFLDASNSYATYWCPIDNVQVPVNYNYTTDGDNVNGVYITVNFTQQKNS